MCEEHVLARDGASGRLTLSQVLARDFPAGSRIEVVNTVRYYLSRSDAKNGKLMREVDHGSNPLIEHVENFSLTYLNERGQSVERLEDVRIIRLYLKTSGIDGRGGRLQRSYTRDMGVRSL